LLAPVTDKVQFAAPRFLLLHFDLDTTKGDRTDTYKAIEAITAPHAPRRLTGSVYAVAIPDSASPSDFAFAFWKVLAAATKGLLHEKDVFFVHYGAGQSGHMDVLFQSPSKKELDAKPDVSVLESLFVR
jgi:hypothetical protein